MVASEQLDGNLTLLLLSVKQMLFLQVKTPPKLLFSQILRGRQRVAVAISSYHSSSYVFNCHVSEYMSELSVRKALKKGQKTTPMLPPA